MAEQAIRVSDLSSRPHRLTVEREMTASPGWLFREWTEGFDEWFAAPGSVLMTGAVNAPFFFETECGAGGTEGAETVVTVELKARDGGAHLRLTQTGFPNAESRDRAEEAWLRCRSVKCC